jgi:hypothetical protein
LAIARRRADRVPPPVLVAPAPRASLAWTPVPVVAPAGSEAVVQAAGEEPVDAGLDAALTGEDAV